MDWKTELAKLPALQEVDSRLDALRAERARLVAGEPWSEQARRAAAHKRRVEQLEAERASHERLQRQADLERQSEEVEAKRIDKRLYSGEVKNPKELEGMQKNLEGARARLSDLETRVLEQMEAIEGLDAQLAPVRQALSEAMAALAQQKAAGAKRVAAIDAELPGLQQERERLAAAVEARVLAEYDRVRSRSGGVGVAWLRGGDCTACGVGASPLVQSRVRKSDRAYTCESCGRILVEG